MPSRTSPRAAALPLLAALLAGCGGGDPSPTEPDPGPGSGEGDTGDPGPAAPTPTLRFTDQAAAAGIDAVVWCGSERDRKDTILESIGQGAAWLDDDLDGELDLFLVNGSSRDELPDPPPTSRYYRNVGGGRFEDVSREAGVDDSAWGNGVAAADFDNDGDTDLFVTNWGPHILYRSMTAEGSPGRFDDVAADAGVDCASDPPMWGCGAAWGDIDADGHLDLFVTHYLVFDGDDPPNDGRTTTWRGIRDTYYGPLGCYAQGDRLFRNRGDGTFEDVTDASGIGVLEEAYSLGVIFTDYDRDGDADIYVANDSKPNYMFRNDGTGVFEERGSLLGLAYGEQGNAQAGMGVYAGDWNRDGRDDILVTNFDDDMNTLYENAERAYRDVSVRSGLAGVSRNLLCWGCTLTDFDNDADLDVFVAAGHVYPRAEVDDDRTSYLQANQLLIQEGGRLVDVSAEAGPAFEVRESSRGTAFGDYDGDGDVDALVSNINRAPTLYRNDTEGAGSWLQVRLVGSRSNRDGVGARVTVRAGELELSAERRAGDSYLSTGSPWMHFGLGAAGTVDQVHVRWPSGRETTHGPFDAAQRVVLEEGE